jgi:hypothetical protein
VEDSEIGIDDARRGEHSAYGANGQTRRKQHMHADAEPAKHADKPLT